MWPIISTETLPLSFLPSSKKSSSELYMGMQHVLSNLFKATSDCCSRFYLCIPSYARLLYQLILLFLYAYIVLRQISVSRSLILGSFFTFHSFYSDHRHRGQVLLNKLWVFVCFFHMAFLSYFSIVLFSFYDSHFLTK